MRTRCFFLAALLAVASCASGEVRLTHQNIASTYSPGEFSSAAASGDLWVVIVGNPFGGDAAAFETLVTDAMRGRHWGQATGFTTTPGADAQTRFRVVMLFDPPVSLNGTRLCREAPSALSSEPGGEGIILFAAFCRGKRLRTQIKGWIAGASGPGDSAFRDLVGQVTNGLFPPDRGLSRDRGSPVFIAP